MQNRCARRQRGFTLVELLVVIGIIAVLISILLPSLNKARRSAQIVACAAQERQIGQMFQIYAAMQKGWLPPIDKVGATFFPTSKITGDPIMNGNWWNGWDQILLDTVMRGNSYGNNNNNVSTKVFLCPSDDFQRGANANQSRSYAINQSKWTSGLDDSMTNAKLGYRAPWSAGNVNNASGTFADGQFVQQARLSAVPQHVWILGENWGQSTVYSIDPAGTPAVNLATTAVIGNWSNCTLDASPARFHSTSWGTKGLANANGGNYLYGDGHVEFIKLQDLTVPGPDSDYKNGLGSKYKDANGNSLYNHQAYSLLEDHWKWMDRRRG